MTWSEAPGSEYLGCEAGRILDLLVATYPSPGPDASYFGHPWTAPGWTTARALLLELSGRAEEARSLLFGDEQRYWDGCCFFDLDESLYYLTKARADSLARTGDSAGALRWLHERPGTNASIENPHTHGNRPDHRDNK